MVEEDGFEGTREEVERAIRRLSILEHGILAVAFLFALGGGWVGAYLLSSGTRLPFRLTWAVLSLLLLVVPGTIALWRDRRDDRASRPGGREGSGG